MATHFYDSCCDVIAVVIMWFMLFFCDSCSFYVIPVVLWFMLFLCNSCCFYVIPVTVVLMCRQKTLSLIFQLFIKVMIVVSFPFLHENKFCCGINNIRRSRVSSLISNCFQWCIGKAALVPHFDIFLVSKHNWTNVVLPGGWDVWQPRPGKLQHCSTTGERDVTCGVAHTVALQDSVTLHRTMDSHWSALC